MPKARFKGALNAASFPFVSTLQARTVMQPQLDINVKSSRAFYGTEESADYSVPQLMYCENVIPTAEGLQSVSYQDLIAALAGASDFDQCITLRDANENNFLFVPAQGKNYIYTANAGAWVSTNPIAGWTGGLVTRAYVNGRTFICYEKFGIYEYNAATGQVVKQILQGLTDADIRGIGASSNYLLAFGNLTVYWSSLVNPVDFIPSLTTGAGFSIPQDVKAKITCIVGIAGGFIVYTAKNAVGAVFTNNVRAPFVFKEISNAGGVATYEQVTNEQNAGPHYAWTTGGLQKITIQGAEPVSAEVNDFIAGRMYETFDPASKILTQTLDSGSNEFNVKVTYISSRYLLISYAAGSGNIYNYVLAYDTILKRWGKLKIDHVDCLAYPYPNLFGDLRYIDFANTTYSGIGTTTYNGLVNGISSSPPSKQAVSFMGVDGRIQLVRMDYDKDTQHQGVVIFGKFQLTRGKLAQMQEVEFEGIYQDITNFTQAFQMTVVSSQDGKNEDSILPMRLNKVAGKYARYGRRTTGVNLWLIGQGTFALSTYLLEVVQEGDR